MSRWLDQNRERKSLARMRPAARAAFKKVGQRLQELRVARGLSQEEAAGRASISPKTLQDYERGASNPTLASLVAVAEAYGISLGKLFEEL